MTIKFTPMGRALIAKDSDALDETLADEERVECPRCHLAVLEDEFSPNKGICIYCVLEEEGWGAGPRFPALAPIQQGAYPVETNPSIELQDRFEETLAALRGVEYAGDDERPLLLADLRKRLESLQTQTMTALGGQAPEAGAAQQVIIVHNAWAVEGMENGKEIETPLATLGRPQDWGDPRWHYSRFRFDWFMSEARYINHVHIWTDLKREESEYPQLFANLITSILIPGLPAQLAGRDALDAEDFWKEEWGPTPPVWDDWDDEFSDVPDEYSKDYYIPDDPREEAE